MEKGKIFLMASIWFSSAIAIIAGLIITKNPYCLLAFVISFLASACIY